MQILIQKSDFSITAEKNICFVTLSSEKTQNAVSLETAAALNEIVPTKFHDFLTKQNCLLIVLRSTVKNFFSSGGHLRDLKECTSAAGQSYSSPIRAFCKLLHSTAAPSIAILPGPSYGGGVELALATDFRWSIGTNSDFFLTQTKFAVPGGWGGMARLSEICPQLNVRKVSALFLGQMRLSFEQMRYLGLIDEVYADGEACYQALYALKDKIASCPPDLRADLMLRTDRRKSSQELYDNDVQLFYKYFLQEEHKKRINIFFSMKNNGKN